MFFGNVFEMFCVMWGLVRVELIFVLLDVLVLCLLMIWGEFNLMVMIKLI